MTEILSLLGLGSLKALVLLATAAILARFLRQRPARLRALLWTAALAGALLIPIATPLLPTMELPIPTVFNNVGPQLQTADRPLVWATGGPANGPAMTQPNTASGKIGPMPRREPIRWTSTVLALWVLGTAVLLIHLALGLLRVHRTQGASIRLADRRWTTQLDLTARRIGLQRPVRLLVSSDIEVPATVGILRPTVLIPMYGRDWNEDRRHTVLLHELVHIQRLDWAVRILARLARSVYWFIPLTWWAVRRLDFEQELACDEEIVALGTSPTAYADHLLSIARSAVLNPAPAMPGMAMARTPDLEKRIMTLLNATNHRRVGIAVLIPAVILVAAMVSALAAVSPSGTMVPPSSPQATTAPANPEIEKIVAEMKAAEREIEKKAEKMQAKEMALQRHIDAIEPIEIDEEAIARIEEAMKPHLARLEAIEIEMQPLEVEMEQLEDEMQDLVLHIEDGTLDEIHRQIDEQLKANFKNIELSHAALEPHLKDLELVHLEMEELHKHLEKIHLEMEPQHEAIEEMHRALEPLHDEMDQLHDEMEPFHRQMEQLGERLDNAISDEVAGRLQTHLGPVTSPGAPFGEAARRIISSARVRIRNEVIDIDSPFNENQEILQDLFTKHRIGTEEAFNEAVTAAAEELEDLRISMK